MKLNRFVPSVFLIILTLWSLTTLYGQTPSIYRDTLTAASGKWTARFGTTHFFALMWGGGAGGNAGWADGVNGYNSLPLLCCFTCTFHPVYPL